MVFKEVFFGQGFRVGNFRKNWGISKGENGFSKNLGSNGRDGFLGFPGSLRPLLSRRP